MNDLTLPIVRGQIASGKRSTVKALSRELGLESMSFDCRQLRGPGTLFEMMRAVLGVGLWLNLEHFDALDVGMTSVFLTVLSAVQTALHSRNHKVYLGGDLIDIVHSASCRPRICIMMNGNSNATFLPASVRLQFRPVQISSPPRVIILTVILSSYNFASVSRVAPRLDAMCDYIKQHKLIHEHVLLRVVLESIRIGGERNDHTPAALPLQTAIAKPLFLRVPTHIQDRITDYDLRFICNLFLEVVFTGNNGGDHDLSSFKNIPNCNSYADILHNHLVHGTNSSIIVVGPAAIGKSRLIRETIRRTVEDHNAEIEKAELKKYSKKNTAPLLRMEMHPRVIYPYVMADYEVVKENNQFMQSVSHSALELAAEHVMEQFISRVDPLGPQQMVHVDTQSSLQLASLLGRSGFMAERHSRQVKFVWESVELNHLDPATVCSIPIIFVKDKSFKLADIIAEHADLLSANEAKVFRILLTTCIDSYIMPCIAQYPKDSFQSQLSLVDNLFRMIGALLRSSGITSTASGSKWSEDSVRRVVLCCCIWTVGVCSPSNKDHFDSWFREYFDADAERTKDRQIYPNCVGHSVYESYLHQPDENRVDLEWTTFHRKVIVSAANQTSNMVNGSEDRLRRSHANLYYTTIFSGSQGPSNMLIPTAAARAYSFIQASLMESGGHVLITGNKGSGKSSLLRELVEISKTVTSDRATLVTAARWVCRTTDCGPKQLQAHITRCRSSLYPLLMERQLLDKGSVVVEDVNMKLHTDNHSTCAEFIRTLCESRQMFNISRGIWQPADKMFTILCSDNSPGYLNERFVRHQMVLCCEPDDLRTVFVQKLTVECPILREDFVDDIVKLSFVVFDTLRRAIRDLVTTNAVNSGSDFEKFTKRDQNYILSYNNRTVASTVDLVLSMTARAIPTMTVFSANDVIKVWDRILADQTVRHPAVSPLMNEALERASTDHSYVFPHFRVLWTEKS